MKKHTAIDWLLESLPIRYKNAIMNTCQEEVEKSREMFKEQIIEAACYDPFLGDMDRGEGEYYYKHTYEL